MNIALPYFKNLWTHHRNVVPISEPQIKINQYFAVKNSWQKNNYEDAIRKYYDQVWIYGDE